MPSNITAKPKHRHGWCYVCGTVKSRGVDQIPVCTPCLDISRKKHIRRNDRHMQNFEANAAEVAVARYFQQKGYRWIRARASRGPADILIWHPRRKTGYAVQVKSSRKRSSLPFKRSWRIPIDLKRLNEAARHWGFQPVIAHVLINSLELKLQITDLNGTEVLKQTVLPRADWKYETCLTATEALRYLGQPKEKSAGTSRPS